MPDSILPVIHDELAFFTITPAFLSVLPTDDGGADPGIGVSNAFMSSPSMLFMCGGE